MPGVEFVGFNRRSRSRLFLFCILCMILLLLHSYKCSWHITSYIVFILEEAYAQAHEKAGITWEGQEFLVEGNPAVLANASAEDDEKGN